MKILNIFKKGPTKREKAVAMIKNMAMIANMPKEAQLALNHLDLTIATDDQVDLIYEGLIKLYKQLDDIREQNGGRDLFHLIKETQN